METNEGFLRRWSRRKQAAQAAPPAPAPEIVEVPLAEPELPSLESLGTASDYTAFLQEGVSAEVQRRALQRAWESDASIAEFRGMAEYAWDFNAPQYGQLWASDDVVKLVQAVLSPAASEPPAPVMSPAIAEVMPLEGELAWQIALSERAGTAEGEMLEQAVDDEAGTDLAPRDLGVRRHGSALPC